MINCGEYLFESSEQIYVFDRGEFYMCYALQGNTFQYATTKEDLKLGFNYGFKSVIEY